MVFVSNTFIFLFLPAFLLVYTLVPARGRNATILLFSLLFYGWWRLDFLPLLIAIAVCSWATGLWMASSRGRTRDIVLAIAVALPLLALVYFKYAQLLVETMISAGLPMSPVGSAILPIGLSFFVFGAISYSVDVYRRHVPAEPSLINYATYQAMFGHLVAGPIVRYRSVAERLAKRSFAADEFAEGARRFMLGFAQKVILADTLAPLVDAGFALPAPTAADSVIAVTAYTFQLYFDFAGYSSMAIGLGLMVGLKFPENFDNPYLACSLSEFWRRWHISLSSWLRDYLYIPLGGNRRGVLRTVSNLLTTMVLGGLWHGASWTFAGWGLWHGVGLMVERLWRARGPGPMPKFAGHVLTLVFVMLGWGLFRAQDWHEAELILSGLLGARGWALSPPYAAQLRQVEIVTMFLSVIVIYAPLIRRPLRVARETRRPSLPLAFVTWLFSLWLIQSRSVIPFLYFQF